MTFSSPSDVLGFNLAMVLPLVENWSKDFICTGNTNLVFVGGQRVIYQPKQLIRGGD
jgi:hypothetical protein